MEKTTNKRYDTPTYLLPCSAMERLSIDTESRQTITELDRNR